MALPRASTPGDRVSPPRRPGGGGVALPFRWGARARSFGHAWRGVAGLVRSQHNARIHLAATLAVAGAGFALGVSRADWGLLVLATAGVWVAEALNTAVEFLADAVHPGVHPLVGRAKDVAAGGVLLASAGAVAIGLLVFGPGLFRWCLGTVP